MFTICAFFRLWKQNLPLSAFITFRGFKALARSAQCWQHKLHQRSNCVLFRFLWFCKAAYFPIIATLENPFSISRTRESFTLSTIHLHWGVNPSTRCILNEFLQLSTSVFQIMFPIQLCSHSCGQSHVTVGCHIPNMAAALQFANCQ